MKKTTILLSLIFLLFNAYSQTDSTKKVKENTKFVFTFEPTYLSLNAFRINQELHILKSGSVVFSEELYAKEGNGSSNFFPFFLNPFMDDNSYDKVYGFGLEVSIKKYLFNSDKIKGFYSGFGVKYDHITLEDQMSIWTTDDIGNEFEESTKDKNIIDKFGLDFRLGYVVSIKDKVFFDFYTGVGLRYSNVQGTENGRYIESGNGISNYGYTGVLPVLGVRLGVGLF